MKKWTLITVPINIDGLRRPVKAILFDFDGVIVDSVDIKTIAFKELFSAFPEHSREIERYHLDHLGVSRYQKFEWIYRIAR